MSKEKNIIPFENIKNMILNFRGIQVMIDRDLAELYQVETRILKQAVKRNIERFPDDFMFELSDEEIDFMVSQNVIPSKKYLGGAKPYAFTEQGVSMLSSVLKSKVAIDVNISIFRAFAKMRKFLLTLCLEVATGHMLNVLYIIFLIVAAIVFQYEIATIK